MKTRAIALTASVALAAMLAVPAAAQSNSFDPLAPCSQVLGEKSGLPQLAIGFWAAQLVLNGAWSWLFFGRRRMDQAFVDVVLLWASILGFIVTAWPISTVATLLFLPYLVWVTIAAALTIADVAHGVAVGEGIRQAGSQS